MKEVFFFPRRICRVVLLALCLMGALPHAGRADTNFRVWGDMDFSFNWVDNGAFSKNNKMDRTFANQRMRILMSARVAENLQGVAMFRFLPARWGQSKQGAADAGYALDGDGVILRNRFLYLDWQSLSNGLQIRLGIQPLSLPFAAFRNGILESSAGGVTATYRFNDNISATAFWARPYDSYANDTEAAGNSPFKTNLMDEMDMFYFALPITFKEPNIKFTPWTMYSLIGKDSGYWAARANPISQPASNGGYSSKWKGVDHDGTAWWAGLSLWLNMFDPLSIKYDFAYGSLKTDNDRALGDGAYFNTQGWNTSLAIDYKLDWAIPGIFAWYASGSNANDVKNKQQWGYVPILSSFGDGFAPTSFGFADAGGGIGYGSNISWVNAGRWGVGAQLDKISSFTPDLTHTIRVAYYRGTNDADLLKMPFGAVPFGINSASTRPGGDYQMMTTKDQAWEVNFNHYYKIYENLTMIVDLGYINLNRCKDWPQDYRARSDAWQVATNFKYTF